MGGRRGSELASASGAAGVFLTLSAMTVHGISVLRWVLALGMVAAGANHFRDPAFYLAIMPSYLPWPGPLIAISGACEIAGGIGLLIPRMRRLAGYGLIALLFAVFPANLAMLTDGLSPPGVHLPEWVLWARIPLQALLIAWVWLVALRRTDGRAVPQGNAGSR